MKKLLLATILACLFASTNAMAIYVEGTISQIRVTAGSAAQIAVVFSGGTLLRSVDNTMTADEYKLFMAAAMTAYASGKTVVLSGPADDFDAIQLR